ncbi:MAG: hypothetical protein KDK97_01735 [Verrucomicrobiales bacterium]|nr:hypothetical protein [Verrucomicrobiales bacterium]MCP5557364.1 hypothetical protein [Verrucomicrobiaceae bacterium]
MKRPFLTAILFMASSVSLCAAEDVFLSGDFHWKASAPLLSPANRPEDPCVSVKDPTVVFHDGRWHLFTTIRSQVRTHQIEYCNFADWKDGNAASRHILKLSDGYFCAPQVFWFAPQKKWYLISQIPNPEVKKLAPAFSTTTDISDPTSWTPPVPLYPKHPASVKGWIDFWIICDEAKAHLFFTSNNGKMWRAETALADFPHGWTEPVLALEADIFEASHTYKLKGRDQYLTVVEAQAQGRRYYKAYTANKLDGSWRPLAATLDHPFAARSNVTHSDWCDSISHGEFLRAGSDEKMEIDPDHLTFLFQGVTDAEMKGKKYSAIPWRLGLLTAAGED